MGVEGVAAVHTYSCRPAWGPGGCLQLGGGHSMGFHPEAAECDPPTLLLLRPEA